jgi:hypothetical protein
MVGGMDKKADKLSRADISTIFGYVNQSLGIELSEKGKKVIQKDIIRRMLYHDNDVEKVKNYFKDYDGEMRKLYVAWDGYDGDTLRYYLTRK